MHQNTQKTVSNFRITPTDTMALNTLHSGNDRARLEVLGLMGEATASAPKLHRISDFGVRSSLGPGNIGASWVDNSHQLSID
jgi:hypothetical protein